MNTCLGLAAASIGSAIAMCGSVALGQTAVFDFDNAPLHASLPVAVSVGAVTATLSASGQGMSIQYANTMGFTPAGFGGLCIYPNSINQSDLTISFDKDLTACSIMFAPQELGCDDTARMRMTGYMGNTWVGDATAYAPQPGTWPVGTLSYTNAAGFSRVVVHYDQAPLCTDRGPIFMADNMTVTLLGAPCAPDFDQNGTLAVADIFAFINAWFAGDVRADFDGSGALGVADIFAFLNAWFAGCP
jgi:hypothetical protein